MKKISRAVTKEQRKLMAALSAAVVKQVDVPAEPQSVFDALCRAMSERRGRQVVLVIREFPETMANSTTGLWLDLENRGLDLVVVEKRLTPDHQLVVLGHELWHMEAGHCGHSVGDAEVVARAVLSDSDHIDWPALARHVAARSHSREEDEVAAEGFGLLLGSRMSSWLATPGTRRLDDVARRIGAALGYNGPQG